MNSPTILYTLADMARALGVSQSALSNRRARGAPRADVQLPAHRYQTRSGRPLWDRAQVVAVLAERDASARRALQLDEDAWQTREDARRRDEIAAELDTPADTV